MLREGWRPPDWMGLTTVAKMSLGFSEDQAIIRSVKLVGAYTMLNFERLATLWEQVRYLDRFHIAGAFVECGVWRGGAVAMMARAHTHGSAVASRTLHLFDSFQGLPEPDVESGRRRGNEVGWWARRNGQLKPIGHFAASQSAKPRGTRENCWLSDGFN